MAISFNYVDVNNLNRSATVRAFEAGKGYWFDIYDDKGQLIDTHFNFKYLGISGYLYQMFFDFNNESPNHVVFLNNGIYNGEGDINSDHDYNFINTDNNIQVWSWDRRRTDITLLDNSFNPGSPAPLPSVAIRIE